ncbi:MAG: alpha/beta fold hydrolase [Lachnospiraceae bacterium]|nr:alpha/beta fold hydrolase [Lachnospiraceae bacterium]
MIISDPNEPTVLQLAERHYDRQENRPGLEGILIPGKRGKLLAALYTAAGPGPHPAVLICHGIPGVERNLDLAQYLRREGFHVMTFHYSGSWGSDGDYSIANDLEDAETVLDFMLNDTGRGFDPNRIFCVGHSLGGYVCGQLAAKRSEIRAAVLLMPCDIGRVPQIKEDDPAAYRAMADLLEEASHWLRGTNGAALLKEAEENAADFALVPAAKRLARIPLLCVNGTLDTDTPDAVYCAPLREAVKAAGGTLLEHHVYPTDHCFSDYRLTIAADICDFLWEAQKANLPLAGNPVF